MSLTESYVVCTLLSRGRSVLNKEKQMEKHLLILEAAGSIFSDKGYPNTKMQEIAEKAGIGKGTIYQYFKSKKHLFQEVIKEGIDLYATDMKKEINKCSGTEENLKKIVRFSFVFMQKHRNILKMVLNHHNLMDKSMIKWIYDSKSKVVDLILEVIEENYGKITNNSQDRRFAVYCFLGMMISIIQEKVFHNQEFDVEKASDQLVKIFLKGYE
jgi:TetR/AcrR family fatty acid metabolism transcriptional regulator